MKKILNKDGFTLVEIIIALGLLGLITLGATSILKKSKQSENRNLRSLEKNSEVKNFLSYLEIRNIDWRGYNPAQSLFLDNTTVKKVDWDLNHDGSNYTLENIAIPEANGSKMYNRSSHTIEKLEGSSAGRIIIFSRCVPKAEEASKLNMAQAYALPNVPSFSWEKDIVKVHCCPKGSLSCQQNQVVNQKSEFQVKTFISRKNRLDYLPKDGDLLIKGMGFVHYFNSPKDPQNYQTISVIMTDRCKMQGREESADCLGQYQLETHKHNGIVLGVQDRGYIQVR